MTTYCSDADLKDDKDHYAIPYFREAVKSRQADELLVGMWAFSHLGWVDTLCSLITAQTATVKIAIDKARTPGERDTKPAESVMQCGLNAPAGSSRLDFMGQGGDFLEFHPKFVGVKLIDDSAVTWISTGNLTRNSQLNFDVGMLISEGKQHGFYDWHSCLLGAFVDDQGRVLTDYRSTSRRYSKCAEQIESKSIQGITPYALPFDRGELENRLALLLGSSTRVSIAVQGADSLRLRDLFLAASKDGTKFRFLRDDDLAYASRFHDLMNDPYEREVWQRPLEDAGAEIRYLLTNHHDGRIAGRKVQGNFLHMKLIIFERATKPPVALVGSANLTGAAFSFNVENQYLVEDAPTVQALRTSFENLWLRSWSGKELPTPSRPPDK